MGPIGDCELCSKNHYTDECFTGDIHYDATSGDVYIYNEKTWVKMSSAGTPLTTTGASSGTHLHAGSGTYTTTSTGSAYPWFGKPSEAKPLPPVEYDEFPTRLQFVSDEMSRHLPVVHMRSTSTKCNCGASQQNYSEHLAQAAIDAADRWDELLMAEESESA